MHRSGHHCQLRYSAVFSRITVNQGENELGIGQVQSLPTVDLIFTGELTSFCD